MAFRQAEQKMPMAARRGEGVVTAVQRALALLDAFKIDDSQLSISELARRTGLAKTTAFRLAGTLLESGYLVQAESGLWRLGPATAWLGARYQVSFDIHNTIEPVLQELAGATGQSASFFVHEGNVRIRLVRVRGTGAASHSVHVGEAMPLDKGSPGKVILAFNGRPGKEYDEIRKRGFHVTVGEAHEAAASVAAPVFGARWTVVGALSLGGAAATLSRARLAGYAPTVVKAAAGLSSLLSRNSQGARPLAMATSTWHP
jgi:DNA-binding IclR family transcriptional regulator